MKLRGARPRPLAACTHGPGIWLLIVLADFPEGLALSAVKRSIGAKDWGSMIEGHGGMPDWLDSVTFPAPIFFHIVHYACV